MPKKKEASFVLPSLDDIFSTQEMRDDEKLRKVRDISIELIDDFPDHPFKVIENEDMMELVEQFENEKLRKCLQSLSKEQLNLLLEYYVLEKSISEIAEEMGLSYTAVTNRLDRIRKALRKATEK